MRSEKKIGESKVSRPFGTALPPLSGLGSTKPCFPCGVDLTVSPNRRLSRQNIRLSTELGATGIEPAPFLLSTEVSYPLPNAPILRRISPLIEALPE